MKKYTRTDKQLDLGPRDAAIVLRAGAEIGDPVGVEYYTPCEGAYPDNRIPPAEPLSFMSVLGTVLTEPLLFGVAAIKTRQALDKIAREMETLN